MAESDSLVERVAVSLWDTDERNTQADSWDECPSYMKAEFRRRARAAIEAMREPTEAQVRHGAKAMMFEPDTPTSLSATRAGWSAMIDAALA